MSSTKSKNPWVQACKLSLVRNSDTEDGTWPPETLDPGVNFFVLALEELGAKTNFSCEGHPKGFYIAFEAPYELAVEIREACQLSVEIWKKNTWTIRNVYSENNTPNGYTDYQRQEALRYAATRWVDYFGPRLAKTLKQIATGQLISPKPAPFIATLSVGEPLATIWRNQASSPVTVETNMDNYSEEPIWEKAHQDSLRLLQQFQSDEPCFMLRVWGVAQTYPAFKAKYGEPNENKARGGNEVYVWWFDTKLARDAFKAEMQEFCKTLPQSTLVYSERDGGEDDILPKKLITAVVTLRYQGKDYVVKQSYGYGYPLGTVIFDWEDNNNSCDCNRVRILDNFHPGILTPEDANDERPCTDGQVPVVAFEFELTD